MKIISTAINLFVLALLLTFSSCQKDKMGEGNDEELITTMTLKFTPVTGGTPLTFTFNDPDGPGGAAPTQDSLLLGSATAYHVEVLLYNNSSNPQENITDEVREESAAHRFYYNTAATGINVSGLDNDTEGKPLGILSTWTTGSNRTGTSTITLRHYIGTPPDKQIADALNSPKSSTDIEISLNTRIY